MLKIWRLRSWGITGNFAVLYSQIIPCLYFDHKYIIHNTYIPIYTYFCMFLHLKKLGTLNLMVVEALKGVFRFTNSISLNRWRYNWCINHCDIGNLCRFSWTSFRPILLFIQTDRTSVNLKMIMFLWIARIRFKCRSLFISITKRKSSFMSSVEWFDQPWFTIQLLNKYS